MVGCRLDCLCIAALYENQLLITMIVISVDHGLIVVSMVWSCSVSHDHFEEAQNYHSRAEVFKSCLNMQDVWHCPV